MPGCYCVVKSCKMSTNINKKQDSETDRVRYFTFPKNHEVCKLWVKACGDKNVNSKSGRICSIHFTEQDWRLKDILLNTPIMKRLLKPNAVPSVLMPGIKNSETVTAREKRAFHRNSKKVVESAINEYNMSILEEEEISLPDADSYIDCEISTGMKSTAVQTEVEYNCAREFRQMETEKKNKALEKEIAEIKMKLSEYKEMENSLKKIYTSGQINKLKNPNRKINWTMDDILAAVCLHSAGPQAYRLLYKNNHPLPGPSTLRAWTTKIDPRPGILFDVLRYMKFYDIKEIDKICVLSFDEMKIKAKLEYDRKNDTTLKPSNYVQVVMARGIRGNWKQPIFYNYDCKMTSLILCDIILKLNDVGYPTVAIVSDMGSTNQGLWKEIGISHTKPWFQSPVDNSAKIFVFADVPHLIKLFRNHFLDSGFMLHNVHINSEPIKEVMKLTSSSEISILFKITEHHLNVKNEERQKVNLATQLFSHTTSCAIKRAMILGKCSSKNAPECADLIKLVNDWFDIFNSKVPAIDSTPRTKAYGLAIAEQNDILQKMDILISNLLAPGKKSLLPFQQRILLTNTALRQLLSYMSEKYKFKFILTYRLNQDVSENFFSAIRGKDGLHDHPTALEFKYRLRSYLLSNLRKEE